MRYYIVIREPDRICIPARDPLEAVEKYARDMIGPTTAERREYLSVPCVSVMWDSNKEYFVLSGGKWIETSARPSE